MGGAFSFLWGYFAKQKKRVLVLGLDGAGKTTLLYKLQMGDVVTTIPTIGFNVETVEHSGLELQVWDLGGQTSIRPYWRCYYANTNAVIFVIDAADHDRVSTWTSEIASIVKEEELKDVPFLILANKQDLEDAWSEAQVLKELQSILGQRNYHVQKCSVLKGDGLKEGIDWAVDQMRKK